MSEYLTVYDPFDGDRGTLPEALVLETLEDQAVQVFLAHDMVQQATSFGAEPYRFVLGQRGPWRSDPAYAVHAEWRIEDNHRTKAFVESRRELFALRKTVLPTFFLDVLFKSLMDPSRFLILGLYGDREGAVRLCREHPDIVAFAQNHPRESFAGRDLTGLRTAKVVSLGDVLSWMP